MTKPVLKNEQDCTGCFACIAACPSNAISLAECGFNAEIPQIDSEKCIGCGKCERVCRDQSAPAVLEKKAFVAKSLDEDILRKSASGGVFSAFAKLILSKGGVVFGSALTFENGEVKVQHKCIEAIEDLPEILGSKYVHSDCSVVYEKIRQLLKEARLVLFGGTSCQVKALYSYLRGCDTENLYTVDLVCHGVPSVRLLNDYIRYLGARFKGSIDDLTFRTKRNGMIKYELSFSVKSEKGTRTVVIPLKKSSYYRMFMGAESYREACYRCEFASVNKPADITAGDYFEIERDYPELLVGEDGFKTDLGISSMIVHSEKGYALLEEVAGTLKYAEVDLEKVVRSHAQLQRPSRPVQREKLRGIYAGKGFAGLDRFYRMRDLFDWKENLSTIVGKQNIYRIKRAIKRWRRG